jgi:hypothetical protein
VQQWYGDASFSGFGFDYGGILLSPSSIWLSSSGKFAKWWRKWKSGEEEDDDEWIMSKNSPTSFLFLMT